MAGNLRKASKSYTGTTRILGQEGTDPRISGLFFKAFVQAVLIFGSEMWVLTPCTERAMGSFKKRIAQRVTGRQPRQRGEVRWEYPPLTEVANKAGFEEIGLYITRRKNTVAQYIAMRPILDLCEQSVWSTGAWVSQVGWGRRVFS